MLVPGWPVWICAPVGLTWERMVNSCCLIVSRYGLVLRFSMLETGRWSL